MLQGMLYFFSPVQTSELNEQIQASERQVLAAQQATAEVEQELDAVKQTLLGEQAAADDRLTSARDAAAKYAAQMELKLRQLQHEYDKQQVQLGATCDCFTPAV